MLAGSGKRRNRILPGLLGVVLGVLLLCPAASWGYTTAQLAAARSKGVYASAEAGMRAMIEAHYRGIQEVKILYAGPNSFDGSQPHVWYVIAEVRAGQRADGSPPGKNGCDAPGLFFLQARDGWVFMPEGAFPGFVGFWMRKFGLAGPGQSFPSTNWAKSQPARFCQ